MGRFVVGVWGMCARLEEGVDCRTHPQTSHFQRDVHHVSGVCVPRAHLGGGGDAIAGTQAC
eukprot:34517-Chlamydomonas_euryale.AAC.3